MYTQVLASVRIHFPYLHLRALRSLINHLNRNWIVFLVELQKIEVINNFTLEFEYVIYVGFGTTALIDMGIAAAMCLMLYKSSGGITKRSNMIVTTLIQYTVGTGLLTSLGALMCMVLYIAKPVSLLYLGVEYSMTRCKHQHVIVMHSFIYPYLQFTYLPSAVYAISVLALYNSQSRLRDRWNEPADLKGGSMLYFAEPEKGIGGGAGGRGGSSSGQEGSSSTQVTTSDDHAHYTRHYGTVFEAFFDTSYFASTGTVLDSMIYLFLQVKGVLECAW
ncbi:hypothetical protein MD484_g807, partial [Candolleomyces efflorescens]